ncbi:hypothetical protein [Flammeovirga sp. SJP92]|uniref:hypothetical protein n=1 Tax=Flammeovirga sp. SJP92 TaxID=1775430 RepID=UPI000788C1C9|nr:hypothetical protein [Flammeovirga sp. SJP92]KXX70934.1 hypothetical protein AVL50_11230 [Flammeovirga sp. SJP92]
MKSIVIIALFFSFTGNLFGQIPQIDHQRKFRLKLTHYLDSIGFAGKANFKEINYELRVWKSNYATGQTKMIQLIQFKSGETKAKSLEYYCYNIISSCDKDNYIIESINLPKNWETSWQNIVDKGLLNIRDQRVVDNALKTPNGEILAIGCGGGLTFEILTKKAKRKFYYSNIDSYIEFYNNLGIHSIDYQKAKELIDIFMHGFDWKYTTKGVSERHEEG